jgi:CRISPR/Cas system-associated protein Cas10 (large subunit of type III CRISPR-Cas system)
MKKLLPFALFFLVTMNSALFAQDSFKQALDDFHHTLAFTYHPMVDDSNYTPIRSRSHELAQKAEALEKSFESEKEKPAGTEQSVEQLVEQCEALDDVIQKGATDEAIRTRLSAIHDKFHQLESMGIKHEEEK